MAIGGSIITRAKARESSISAVVTRANGKVEDLGVIAYYHRNPLKRWFRNLYIWLARRIG